jgi:hypothetical protein
MLAKTLQKAKSYLNGEGRMSAGWRHQTTCCYPKALINTNGIIAS